MPPAKRLLGALCRPAASEPGLHTRAPHLRLSSREPPPLRLLFPLHFL